MTDLQDIPRRKIADTPAMLADYAGDAALIIFMCSGMPDRPHR
jgi:hypothetical protein